MKNRLANYVTNHTDAVYAENKTKLPDQSDQVRLWQKAYKTMKWTTI